MKTITIRISEGDLTQLDRLCEDQHRKRSNLIQVAIRYYLDRIPDKKAPGEP